MRSISFDLLKHMRFIVVVICLSLADSQWAVCKNLGGKDFIGQYIDVGFEEVPGPPLIKVFLKTLHQQKLEVLNAGSQTKPIRLTVYIEGDGASWRSRQVPPRDPSPENPTAAHLALADSNTLVAYMARPCMYLASEQLERCSPTLWTDGRFGKEVLALSNQALDSLIGKIKNEYLLNSSRPLLLNLVGYSGGGVVAALLAAQRADVVCLNTLASPLDIEVWTRLQKVAPLSQSFNPAFPDARLSRIPQMHWFGAEDRLVPPQALGRYHKWDPALQRDQVIQVIPNFNHRDFWVQEWPNLKERACLN